MSDNTSDGRGASIDRRAFVAGLGAGATVGAAGCQGLPGGEDGTTDGEENPITEQMDDPPSGGRFAYGLPVEPDTLNPLRASTTYEFEIVEKIYGTGTNIDPRNVQNLTEATKPWQFQEYEVMPENAMENPSSPTLTATLRDDLTFNDGEAVEASDYKFTVDYIKEQEPGGSINASQFAAVTEVTADGQGNVDVYMSRKDFRWHGSILGTYILPQHIWKNVSDHSTYAPRNSSEGLVGSGPMTLEDFNWQQSYSLDFRPAEEVPMVQDAEWIHDDAPFLEGVDINIFGSPSAMEQALLDGTVDAIYQGMSADRVTDAQDDENLSIIENPSYAYNHISVNMRRVPFDDKAFRQFLVLLTDKQWIVEGPAYRGIGAVEGDYVTLPAFEGLRPPRPEEGDSYEGIDLPDLTFPGTSGDFNISGDQIETAREFLTGHEDATHDYRFVEPESGNATGSVSSTEELQIKVNGEGSFQPFGQAHTDNDGNGGQGPLEFSYQPPQEDNAQNLTGNNLLGVLKKVGVPIQAAIQPINNQLGKIYVNENFDMYAMGWGVTVYQTHLSGLYTSEQADMDGTETSFNNNPMKYTGADDIIFEDRATMDYSARASNVKKACAQIYHDAPTNITEYTTYIEPVDSDYGGFYETVGGVIEGQGLLNVYKRES